MRCGEVDRMNWGEVEVRRECEGIVYTPMHTYMQACI